MIRIINVTLLCTIYSSICFANQPDTTLQKFVPPHWEIISQANGDLNADGQTDTAIIIQPQNKPQNNNQQQRKLLILFQTQSNQQLQLKLSRQIPNWTYRSEDECLEDALDDSALTIKNQRLDLQFNTSPSCSNSYGFLYTYGFKLKNNQFHLVGFDSYALDKISGQQDEISLNFLTHKAKLTTTPNIFAEIETPPKIAWKTFQTNTRYTLENIPLDNDEFNHHFSLKFTGEK